MFGQKVHGQWTGFFFETTYGKYVPVCGVFVRPKKATTQGEAWARVGDEVLIHPENGHFHVMRVTEDPAAFAEKGILLKNQAEFDWWLRTFVERPDLPEFDPGCSLAWFCQDYFGEKRYAN